METKKWVELRHDTVYTFASGHEINLEGGQVGWVTAYPGDDKYEVAFPEYGCFLVIDKEQVKEWDIECEWDVSSAMQHLAKYEGHHTSYGEFQFNIKNHAMFGSFPAKVETLYAAGVDIWDYFYECVSEELRSIVGHGKYPDDYSFSELFNWVHPDLWYTAGRQSGWLVITHAYKLQTEYFENELTSAISEMEGETEYLLELMRGNEHYRYGYESILEGIQNLAEQIEERKAELYEFVTELQWIENRIDYLKEDLAEYVKSEDFWSGLLDNHSKLLELLEERRVMMNRIQHPSTTPEQALELSRDLAGMEQRLQTEFRAKLA